jgi:small subunit ribosomal protein S16
LGAKIKLQRQGTKSKPFYRIVVQDESFPRNGRVIEIIGQYDPNKEPSFFNVNKEKIAAWLSKGAQPTEKLRILLGKAGILPAIDLAALPKKKSKAAIKAGGEEKPAEAAAAAPAEAPAKAEAEAAPAA